MLKDLTQVSHETKMETFLSTKLMKERQPAIIIRKNDLMAVNQMVHLVLRMRIKMECRYLRLMFRAKKYRRV